MNNGRTELTIAFLIAAECFIDDQETLVHSLEVQRRCWNDEMRVCALLHDTIENKKTTLQALQLRGIGETNLSVIQALTRLDGETYFDYIERVKNHSKMAIEVKLADLGANLARNDLTTSLWERWTKATRILKEART